MNADYTPGHALNEIIVGQSIGSETLTPILTRLYKSGQSNERAAIVAELRTCGNAPSPHFAVASAAYYADLVEWGSLS